MKLVKTAKCTLHVDAKQAEVLLETLRRFADACNDILRVSQRHRTTNCYRTVKETYGLQANLVIRAIARVAEAVKKKRKPEAFKPTSMNLDQRTFSFNEKRWEVSVSTVAGRLKLPLAIGNFQRGLLAGQKPTSATLCYNRRKKEFSIHIAVEREVPSLPGNGDIVGVDRGIYNLAATSNGLKFSGRQAMHVRRRYARLRQALQTKGTKGAKRLLKRLSGKERRWMADLTSQRCPRSGSVAKGNRKGHVFRCASCGFVGHADFVAATNIRQAYVDALADGPPSVGPEAASSCKPLALAMG